MNLSDLKKLGFDQSKHIKFTGEYKVKCSQCQAVVINGVPCHETGCPNAKGVKHG